jgi:hypothetical protein
LAQSDGHDLPGLIDELIPSIAAMVFLVASRRKPHLTAYAPKPFSRLGLTVKAGNVLLHTTWKSNDDMPSGADFERLRVKGNLIGGFWHFANMSVYFDESLRLPYSN